MEHHVDSLKVTSMSFASMGALFYDVLPWILGITVGILQIIYLIKKLRNK